MTNNNPLINFNFLVTLMVIALCITVLSALSFGSVDIPFSQLFTHLLNCTEGSACSTQSAVHQILWEIRIPKTLMALITGAGLSVTGAILQSVTRNPLADPYLFGISSGAALGAVIVMSAASSATLLYMPSSITLGALIGSAFSVFLMLSLAGRSAMIVERLLLSGVAISFILSAFTSLILYYSNPDTAATLLFWMMGSFSNSQWHQLTLPAVTLIIGISIFLIYRHWISAILAGDETALSLGVPVNQLRLAMLLVGAAITAVIVSQVGGIGFVGLMMPHIARYLVGPVIHRQIIMSVLLGATFMIWVDVIANTILENQVLPVGIVTSILGGLFFFIILKRRTNY